MSWTVPGQDGIGLVQVGIQREFVGEDEPAFNALMDAGCIPRENCTTHAVQGGGEVLVNDGSSSGPDGPDLGVVFRQPNGEWVFVAIYDTFGNQSLVGVDSVEVTLEQAIAFVTDPGLHLIG